MAVVTDVTKVRSKYRITLDDRDVVWMTGALYAQRSVQAGEHVDPEEFDQWIMLRQYRAALEHAVELLAARDRSTKEISDSLLRIGYRPCTVEMVLCKLDQQHLLNDRQFALQWTQSRAERQLGKRRIAQELRMKGISQELIASALEELDEQTQEESALLQAAKALKRSKPGEDPRKARDRAIAALLRRGYDWSQAKKAVELAAEQAEDI